MSVGTRLKEERKRLGHTQEAMGVACGVTKRMQILYEQDTNAPGGVYLAAAHELGTDIAYVLTGERTRIAAPDAELLEAWRAAPAPARVAAMAALTGGVSHASALAPTTAFNDTTIAQQFSGNVDLRDQTVVVKSPKAKKRSGR